MHCKRVWRAIGLHVVPDQQGTGLRRDGKINAGKIGRAAFFDGIQIGHSSPATLTSTFLFRFPKVLRWQEVIVMPAEFLPRQVSLALDRFSESWI